MSLGIKAGVEVRGPHPQGFAAILNVAAGDTKISFDPKNPAERIRAARIVKDMMRRGYSLMVEVERNGEKVFVRAHEFDENVCEYIIADLDPDAAQEDAGGQEQAQEAGAKSEASRPAKPRGKATKRVPADSTRSVAVGRTAGG